MRNICAVFVSAISLTCCEKVYSAPPDFKIVDIDNDGVLSSGEARLAFPGIIVDVNIDGFIDKSEVEYAIKTIKFPSNNSCQDNLIREVDYQMIVDELESRWKTIKDNLGSSIYFDIQ